MQKFKLLHTKLLPILEKIMINELKKNKYTTRVLKPFEENIAIAAAELQRGGVVAFGTETVYGLGADAFNKEAVAKIFAVKGRPSDNPLIVHIASLLQIKELAEVMPDTGYELAKHFMPGALTIILKKKKTVPNITTGGLDSVAVRMPLSKNARSLIEASGLCIAAPSANRSGFVSPTEAKHVFDDLKGRIPYIIDNGPCSIGLESTVIDLTAKTPTILREGAVSHQEITKLIGAVNISKGVLADGEKPLAPGMKYRHYAPKAEVLFSVYHPHMHKTINAAYDKAVEMGKTPVILCLDNRKAFYENRQKYFVGERIVDYARNLYAFLRAADVDGFNMVLAEGVPTRGIGAAIVNRLLKASDNKLI